MSVRDEWHDDEPVRLNGHEAAYLSQVAQGVARRIRKHDPRRVIDVDVVEADDHRVATAVGRVIGIVFWTGLGWSIIGGRAMIRAARRSRT